MGVLVPQIKEDIVQNLVGEQIVDVLVLQIQDDGLQLVSTQEQRGSRGSYAFYTTRVRAESYVGADRGRFTFYTTGARAQSYAGSERGCASSLVQGGRLAPRTTGACAKSCR